MTRWFGESWGAPICDPEIHAETPVGAKCIDCGEPIEAADQGVMVPHVEMIGDVYTGNERPHHLDCWLDHVLPHGPECDRCRGLDRRQHTKACSYVKHGRKCDCANGAIMAAIGEAKTLEEALRLGETLGFARDAMLSILEYGRQRKRRQCRGRRRT